MHKRDRRSYRINSHSVIDLASNRYRYGYSNYNSRNRDLKKTTFRCSKADWMNQFVLLMIAYYFGMAFVGLLIPDKILKDNPGARAFSDLWRASFRK